MIYTPGHTSKRYSKGMKGIIGEKCTVYQTQEEEKSLKGKDGERGEVLELQLNED